MSNKSKHNGKKLSVEEALDFLYNKIDLSYSDFVDLPENKGKSSLFAKFIKVQLDRFIDIVKAIDESILVKTIQGFGDFKGNISKCRFINLLKEISDDSLKILKECYCPNQAEALNDLECFLGNNNKKFMQYLDEQLINYCAFDYTKNVDFYRVRDEDYGKQIDNCWHTPYNIRQKSYAGRFSSPGFPCLYLAASPETCCAEVGNLNEGKTRWLGKFNLNKMLICLDLRIPNKATIAKATDYEKIQLFLSYPLRILCTTRAINKSDRFAEEYLFSQALINVLSYPLNDNSGMCRISGIIYDSTKDTEGINIALPAKSEKIPPDLDETYSKYLKNLFNHDNPEMIDTIEPNNNNPL